MKTAQHLLVTSRLAALAGVVAGVTCGPLTGLASAAPADVTTALCRASAVPCSVQAPGVWVEGAQHEVSVTGDAGVTIRVQAQRLVERGGATTFEPLGKPVSMTTDAHGFASADLRLPRLASGLSGGPVLLAPADADLSDLTHVLGAWTSFASHTPTLLGDGYRTRKPAGQELVMQVADTIGGTAFDVEIDDHDTWTSIGTTRTRSCAVVEPCAVGYRVPRGLTASDHQVRLVNLSTGTPVGTWTVRPAETGTQQARTSGPTVPAVGSAVTGSLTAGTLGQPVRRARAENLTLPDGATVADATSDGSAWTRHPFTGVRIAAAAVGAGAVLGAVTLLRRRRA